MATVAKKKRKPKKSSRSKKPAIKQLFSRLKEGDFKIPKNLRKAVVREMDQEERRFRTKVNSFHSKIVNPKASSNPFADQAKMPGFKSRLVELFDEKFQPKEFDMPDLLNPRKKVHSQLSKLIWLEKGQIQIPQTSTTPSELKESWRQTHVAPDQVKGYFDKGQVELKESGLDESNFQGSFPVDRQDGSLAGKYFPYPPSSFTRQMYVPDSWFMLARAAHAYNYNPMAKAGIDIKTAFIVGNGPRVLFNNNDALSVAWKEFEKDEDLVETLRTWCSMLGINGELFIEFYKDLTSGNPTVRSIDPGHVYDIITEPRDIRKVYGYRLMYQTQYQIYGEGAKGEQVPLSEWINETVTPDNILHTKVNVQENEKRGRSDLLAGMAVLQLFEDYIRYKVLRAIVEAAFVWDVEMTGADQEQIDSFLADESQVFPEPGSTRAHNENTKWSPLASTAGAASRDDVFEMLLTIFAVSINLPKEYMGASSSGSRANAITSSEPAVKAFQSRRRKLESLILRIVDFLAETKGIDYDPDQVEVTWDEIAPEDINKKIDRLYTEMDRDTFTKERIDEMIAKLEGVTNYDWNMEMANRLKEKTGGIAKSLADGSTPMTGSGIETPELGKPVVPATPAATPGAPGEKTAATSPATSGAPSSLSAQDKLDAKNQGKTL